MSSTLITFAGKSYNLVAMPSSPGPTDIELAMSDSVAVFTSPFTGAEQVQPWPGADQWEATITLPSMYVAQAAAWEVFFASLIGKANVFQLGDARYRTPLAGAAGNGKVATAATPMTYQLVTNSWTGTVPIVGDYLQVQYRLHKITSVTTGGAITFGVWPSIRESIAVGVAVTSATPKGLFRLADNRRAIQWSVDRLTTISFKAIEAR